MLYGVHPNRDLIDLFKDKPYQGVDPYKAKIVIIGNDANYSPDISKHVFFEHILDYHSDGVRFWKKYNTHHPFLLSDYPFDKRKHGVKYHKNFSKMGFNASHADQFSFLELLNIPTTGNTGENKDLFFELLDRGHLSWIEDVILTGNKKFVLVNQTLTKNIINISRKHNVLRSLAKMLSGAKTMSIAHESESVVIYNGYSFSHSISNNYLNDLGNLMLDFIENT